MKKIALIATLLIAACGTTPAELRKEGLHFETKSTLPADAAARCLVKNIEAESSSLHGRITPMPGGAYEVLFRRDDFSHLLLDLQPSADLTTIKAWLARGVLPDEANPVDVLQKYLKGC